MVAGDRRVTPIEEKEKTMEDVEIKQTRGPTLRFKGTLLAEEAWDARDGVMRLELWQTEGGALIPVTDGPMRGGRDVRAEVVRPIAHPLMAGELDFAAMQDAVMDFFAWDNRARSMVRKHLKWSLVRDVA